jgi:WS/DGAT/MGAT family acyltransferase
VITARRVRAAWPALRELFTADPATPTSLNRMVGQDRTFALIRSDLNLVKDVAHGHGATVNDVLLAITAGGLRALLVSRGEALDSAGVRVYVPVTLRPAEGREQARGNLIGQMVVPLPVGTADPGLRLEQIAAETATRKVRSRPALGAVFGNRLAGRALLAVLGRRPVNVTTADLPGPRQPLYLAGARLLEVFPVLPLIANVSLGVGALSYTDQFAITVIADKTAYPDLDVFAAALGEGLRAFAAATRSVTLVRARGWQHR